MSSTLTWRKSSRSGGSGGQCVEIADLALGWRKSSSGDSSGGACVELAGLRDMIAVRDSKDPDGAVLAFGRGEFRALARQIRTGHFDR
jgi:Domain of unknown function (DUF397)